MVAWTTGWGDWALTTSGSDEPVFTTWTATDIYYNYGIDYDRDRSEYVRRVLAQPTLEVRKVVEHKTFEEILDAVLPTTHRSQ